MRTGTDRQCLQDASGILGELKATEAEMQTLADRADATWRLLAVIFLKEKSSICRRFMCSVLVRMHDILDLLQAKLSEAKRCATDSRSKCFTRVMLDRVLGGICSCFVFAFMVSCMLGLICV